MGDESSRRTRSLQIVHASHLTAPPQPWYILPCFWLPAKHGLPGWGRIGTIQAVISAQTVVNVPVRQAREWFLALEHHPERYRFATHQGFEFVCGSFGAVGARFRTRERFGRLAVELLFELTQVTATSFQFRPIRPGWLGVWGTFTTQEEDPQSSILRLDIGSHTRLGSFFLWLYPFRQAIHQQIAKEVAHIKASMEQVARTANG